MATPPGNGSPAVGMPQRYGLRKIKLPCLDPGIRVDTRHNWKATNPWPSDHALCDAMKNPEQIDFNLHDHNTYYIREGVLLTSFLTQRGNFVPVSFSKSTFPR